MPIESRICQIRSPAAPSFAAPASRWRCRGWSRSRALRDTDAGAPSRSASRVLFMGNGINEDHWWAKGSGAEMELSKSLEPLEPLKHKINVIHGLFNKRATGIGIHPAQTGNILSGAPIQKGAIIKAGISVDQCSPTTSARTRRSQPRPGLRAADDRLSRDQLLDGLQLAHLLAERRLAGADGGLSRRSPSTACSRTAAACAT